MRDWKSHVREHLQLNDLSAEREMEIVEDLAQQLEDVLSGGAEKRIEQSRKRSLPPASTFRIGRALREKYHKHRRVIGCRFLIAWRLPLLKKPDGGWCFPES